MLLINRFIRVMLITILVFFICCLWIHYLWTKYSTKPVIVQTSVSNSENTRLSELDKTGKFRYRELDTYTNTPWKYDERFKNPCWYDNGTLRCLPYFFIIGLKKCGTSSLYQYINKHGDVIRQRIKEPMFFGGQARIRRGIDTEDIMAYTEMFRSATKEIERHSKGLVSSNVTNKYIFGEASTTLTHGNMKWKERPGNVGLDEPKYVNLDYIYRLLPRAKILITVRDPVERMYSDYYFHLVRDKATRRIANRAIFHKLVVDGIREFNNCLTEHALRFCAYEERLGYYDNRTSRHRIYLSTGMYHVHLEEALRLFPKDQVLLLKMNDLQSRVNLERIYRFLEMEVPTSETFWKTLSRQRRLNTRHNELRSKGPMLNRTRKLLYDFYRPYNERLVAFTGDKTLLFADSDF